MYSNIGLQPKTSSNVGQVLENALRRLEQPIGQLPETEKNRLFKLAFEKCNRNAAEARAVYELAVKAIYNQARIDRSKSVMKYVLEEIGVGTGIAKKIIKLQDEHVKLQEKIAMACIQKSEADIMRIPDIVDECSAITRTISLLLTTSLKLEEVDEDIEKDVANFFIRMMELEADKIKRHVR